ncbi:hypothetical protein [Pedobacter sp. Leaf176]|uniref:hypothetical protein n=1 Tax=Pedobacter sp. Leaf176 TaxID=1736286 RepID=UPI0006F79619|nr:hypothetical protein [Pedobacter sp. Leaf176]KQR71099.1 hypothetical protein ASF92_06800 [Pedobacter sp. Leaf176]
MKIKFFFFIAFTLLYACKEKTHQVANNQPNIQGTWKLISGTITDRKSGKITNYLANFNMIKIINDTHFAFLKHSKNPEDSTGFDAGGGTYLLNGSTYTEHLTYYKNKNWEGKTFDFKLSLAKDTLIQTGLEKVEKEGIDRVIVEKYVKESN